MTGPGGPGPDPDLPSGPGPGPEIPGDPDLEGAAGPDPESGELPGLRTFSLEGRHAAGLYLVGWLASLLGAATILVVLLAQSSDLPGAILLGIGTLLLALGLAAAAGSQAIERQAAAELGYRGPSPFLLFGSTVALTLFLELIALPPMRALGIATGSTLEALIDLLILNGSALLVVALLVVGSGGLTWWEMLLPRRVLGGAVSLNALLADVGTGMLVGIPVLFLTIVLGAALIALLGVTPPSPLPVAQSPAGALVNIVSGVIVAPLGEELFYRGFATTAWVRGMGSRAGILRGALLFALVHVLTLSGPPSAALIAFGTRLPVAVALGWIYVRRGSLAASFGLHALFNAIPLILVGLSVG